MSERTGKILIKKCHLCGHISESSTDIKHCPSCKKHFTPINYLLKTPIPHKEEHYEQLFGPVEEIAEEDLIKGIQVLW